MSNLIRVVSSVADKKKVVLYKEDGDTIVISQGDHRLKALLDEIIPITLRGEVAAVSLDKFSVYAEFEQKSNGLVKMFRVAKNTLKSWLGGTTETQLVSVPVGDAPGSQAPQPSQESLQPHLKCINENDEVSSEETVVALVGGKVIPDIEKIKPLIAHAARTNSTVAVERFLNRLSKIIDKRRHSVEDLMRFLEKGDLPLAEDGSIIAYKILKRSDNGYVDCYTGNVTQQIGSYVCVDESLVDLSRHNECSNGLHIASRSYIGSFGGDVCTLCKIDPEDVMVVPHADANKIRVKGYHILAELSEAAYSFLRSNKPMTKDEGSMRLVYEAIKGNHIGRIETVKIGGSRGSNLTITPLVDASVSGIVRIQADAYTYDMRSGAALDDEVNQASSVQPREINKMMQEMNQEPDESEEISQEDLEAAADFYDQVVANGGTNEGMGGSINEPELSQAVVRNKKGEPSNSKTAPMTKAEVGQVLYSAWAQDNSQQKLQAILDFKKKAKKGWPALGFTPAQINSITKASQ